MCIKNKPGIEFDFEGNIAYASRTDCELSNVLAVANNKKLILEFFAKIYQDETILTSIRL